MGDLRIDVVSREAGTSFVASLETCLRELQPAMLARTVGAAATKGFVTVTLRLPEQAPVSGPCVRTSVVNVGPVTVLLNPVTGSAAWLTVSLELRQRIRRALGAILKVARRKLRRAVLPSILWVELDHLDVAVEYLEEVVAGDAYANIPLVIVNNRKEARMVHRTRVAPISSSLDAVIPALAVTRTRVGRLRLTGPARRTKSMRSGPPPLEFSGAPRKAKGRPFGGVDGVSPMSFGPAGPPVAKRPRDSTHRQTSPPPFYQAPLSATPPGGDRA